MIYDNEGKTVNTVYDVSGAAVNKVYDMSGNEISIHPAVSIKVMAYNVGQWYIGGGDNVPADKDADYYALQNGMIETADADVVFISEYWDVFSKTGRTALSMLSQYYPYIQTQGGGSGFMGRAICSKFPLSNWTHHAFSNETARYYDSAEITVNGVTITLVVTHLSTNQNNRMGQIPELISYFGTLDTFIAGGDYNTGVKPGIDDQRYETNVVPFIEAGYPMANFSDWGNLVTCNDGVDGGGQDYCIDNIVASPNITFTSAYVDTTKLTDQISGKIDHMPLIATLTI